MFPFRPILLVKAIECCGGRIQVGRTAELHIGRFTPSWPIQNTRPSFHLIVGGPDALLSWLETQLGLLTAPPTWSGRITEYAALLEGAPGAAYARSLEVDRWATSAELLARRDELRMAGWDGFACEALPPILNDMAAAEGSGRALRAGTAERLQAVAQVLESGLTLPPHRCVLRESAAAWPSAWQRVLERMEIVIAEDPAPAGTEGSALRVIQERTQNAEPVRTGPDGSVRWVSASSVAAAVEAVADALGHEPDELAHTAICCEDASVALRLDRALARRGLPTMGAGHSTVFAPALQVLPLVLGLCYEPVDAATLLEFVSLPRGPLPRRVGRRLARALADQPGLGSRVWDAAVAELTSEEKDPDGKTARRLAEWFDHPRFPHGSPLPSRVVAERCGKVARWAIGLASAESIEDEAHSLTALAGQAKTLGELAASQGGSMPADTIWRPPIASG